MIINAIRNELQIFPNDVCIDDILDATKHFRFVIHYVQFLIIGCAIEF